MQIKNAVVKNASISLRPVSFDLKGCAYFNGNNSIYNTTANLALVSSSTPFTVEAWIYPTQTTQGYPLGPGTVCPIISIGDENGGREAFGLDGSSSNPGTLAYNNYGSGNQTLSGANAIVANVWQHVAFVSDGTTLTGYVNGVATGSFMVEGSSSGVGGNPNGFYVGGASNFTEFPGYITNLRYVRGTAVYTGNFVPPKQPLTAIANTELLMLATDSAHLLTDSSINNYTLTNNGSVTWHSFII